MTHATRRRFLSDGFAAGLGLGFVRPADLLAAAATRRAARAEAVIHIHLEGGLSHLDTFDPKPEAPLEIRGPFGSVKSKLDGEPFGELVPKLAAVADQLTVVRSFTHTEADHDRGQHSVLTGYQPSPAIEYPSLGAVVAHELGGRNDLPAYVCVPSVGRSFGAGYLSSAYAPFAVGGNPAARDFAVRDLAPPKDVDAARTARRRSLQQRLDAHFEALGDADAVRAIESYYQQAYALIDSPKARAAFDLAAEPEAQKERYGRRPLGMGCLLARRLVADLAASGLLASTAVLVTTEFGRTPRLNADAGRDHWCKVFSVVLAGGGFKAGCVYGASNAGGAEPERDPVRPADLAASLFTLLGIDPGKRLLAPGNRPIDLVRDGRVLPSLLA